MRRHPTTARGRATVERVLDAACALLAASGIRATALDDIEATAGVGRSQLYFFFAGKPDLIAEVVRRQARGLIDSQQPLLGAFATAAEFRNVLVGAVSQYETGEVPVRCPLGSLAAELAAGEASPAREALAAGFIEWRDLLEAGLRRIVAAGEARAETDPVAGADAVLAAYQGGVLVSGVSGDLGPLRRALAAVGEALLVPATPAQPPAPPAAAP